MSTLLGAHIRCTLLLLFLWFAFSPSGALAQTSAAGSGKTRPYTVVYKLKPAFNSNARVPQKATTTLQQTLKKVGAKPAVQKFPKTAAPSFARRVAPSVDLSLIYELKYRPDQSFSQVKKALMATGMVEYVEPMYAREPLHQPADPASDSLKTTQYYLKLLQAYRSWDVQQGDTNIVIGILDTGFRLSHTDLKANIKHNHKDPIDGTDNDGDGFVDNYAGWDFADNDNDVNDDTPYRGHGTGVAGVAAATHNSVGMAGLGFKTKFLPLKVFSKSSNGNFGGFEAIVYAADKGCKIINLSWGGEGYSQYEQDIINYAVLDKDVVIVASGGNTNQHLDIYPASYNNVLSVGGTDQADVKYKSYTYSYKIDVSAPSVNIYTTNIGNDNAYAGNNGTSFASPAVAGGAALLRAQFPELNALQVMERIRASADDIYTLEGNQPYLEMLGKGRVNLKRALLDTNLKSLRATNVHLANGRTPQTGDTVALEMEFVNYLAATENLGVTLSCSSPYVKILDEQFMLGQLGTMARKSNTKQPFRFVVLPGTPHNTKVNFRLAYTDGTYSDFQYTEQYVNPDYVTLSSNNLHVTVNSKGNFGYNGFNFDQGIGLTYKGSNSLLFEGGLMVASGPTQVSDNVRNDKWELDNDFTATSSARLYYNSKSADMEARTVLAEQSELATSVGVNIKHKAFSWNTEADKDFVILEYYIQNISEAVIENVYAGLFADWDIGSDTYQNAAEWDAENKLGYAYSTVAELPYAGIKLLTHDEPLYYAIDNIGGEEGTVSVSDGFTTDEKYKTLSNGIARTTAWGSGFGNDISHVVGASAKNLAPGETKIIAFALLAGDNLDDLKSHAEAAQQKYYSIKTGPAPLAVTDTLCINSSVTWAPTGGSVFNFYADAAKKSKLKTGRSYTIKPFTEKTTIYATNADSLFESIAVAAVYAEPAQVTGSLEITPAKIYPGTPVSLKIKSQNGSSQTLYLPLTETTIDRDTTIVLNKPGSYEARFYVTDRQNCNSIDLVKTIEVLPVSPMAIAETLQLFPNPATSKITVDLLPDGSASKYPVIQVWNATGRLVMAPIRFLEGNQASIDISNLTSGIYHVRFNYSNTSIMKRIVVAR